MKKNKGFTLIELLVVIAIIGILAAIVLVSLSGARNSAKDARIQADMSQLRTKGETLQINDGSYVNFKLNADKVTLFADITTQGGTPTMYVNTTGSTGYCAMGTLNGGGFWCVDSGLKSAKDANGTAVSCVAGCEALNTCACDN